MNDLFLAPFVIMRRLPQLWFEALHPNPLNSRETQRAVSEKLAAFGEGVIAAQTETLVAMADFAGAVMTGRVPDSPLVTQQRITEAALAPAGKRVRANMRRLAR
jgi:hypothetical protein